MKVATTLIRIFVDGEERRLTCATTAYPNVVQEIVEKNNWLVQEIVEKEPSTVELEKKFEKEVWVTVQEKSDTNVQA